MKAVAIILIVLLLAAVCAVCFLYFTANLSIHFESCVATDAVTQVDYFNQMKSQVENKSFVGTIYDSQELGAADQYQFLTYPVSVQNRAFLNADIVELQITPMPGDVLLLGDVQLHSIPGGKTETLTATILTARDVHTIVREGTVTWYFWGKAFSAKLTLGQ